jgi:hypothetical protein
MPGQTLALLTKDCNVAQLAEAVAQFVFGQLSDRPTRTELEQAYRILQDTYRRYQRANHCKALDYFPATHHCLTWVWQDAYDRLQHMENLLPPAAPQKRQKTRQTTTVTETEEENLAKIIKAIENG